MKHLFFFFSSILILSTNVLHTQSINTVEANKKQILELWEQFSQQVLIEGNLNTIKDYYPKNGVKFGFINQKIEKTSIDQDIKSISSQLENVKYTSFNLLSDPEVFITDDGRMAIASYTIEFGYEVLKTKKKDKFSVIGVDVLIKENGKWVTILEVSDYVKDERKLVTVNKSILNEYNGTYKSETNENIYTVTNDGKNLILGFKGQQYTFFPQSEYSFFMEGQSQSIIFGRNKKGKVSFYTFINSNTCYVRNKID